MAEYIERGAALREAKYAAVRGLDPVAFVEDVPVADVAPVVHGRWIKGPSNPYCSECFVECRDETPFCPNCGAKMNRGKV